MYCDLWQINSKNEQQTGLLLATLRYVQVSGFSVKFSEHLLVNHVLMKFKMSYQDELGKLNWKKRLTALKKLGRQNTLNILCTKKYLHNFMYPQWKQQNLLENQFENDLLSAFKSLNWDEKLFSISTFSVWKMIACLKPTTYSSHSYQHMQQIP